MTSCADQCRFAGSHRKNAPARTASPAVLVTRPIGTPSIAADAERHGLGAVLLISRGRPCGCGIKARGRHRCGTAPPDVADAERLGPGAALLITLSRPHERGTVGLANQNADHLRRSLLARNGKAWLITIVITGARCYGHGSGGATIRMRIRIICRYGCGSQAAADTGTYRYQWTVRGLAQVRLYYSTPVLLCGYAHTTISAYAHMRIKS